LDVGQMSLSSDQKIAMATYHRELWFFGSKRIEAWVNTGNNAFPFQPIGGAPIDHGIAAPFSAVVMDNTIFWLGADATGGGIVWKASGYTPQRVSTHAVETMLHRLSRFNDAIAWVYSQEGHLFYVLYLPQADTTWVYDVASNLWHERALWDTVTMRWKPHVGITHAYAWGMNLVGDRMSGAIYRMDLDFPWDQLVGEQPFTVEPDVESASVSPSASLSPSPSPSGGGSASASISPSASVSPSETDTEPDFFDIGDRANMSHSTWYSGRNCPIEITGINAPTHVEIRLSADPGFTEARFRIFYLNPLHEVYGYWSDYFLPGDGGADLLEGDLLDVQVYTGSAAHVNECWVTVGSFEAHYGVTVF